MTTKVLFLTFYYPPDLSAGSFRSEALVSALLAELGENIEIEVVTTCPNRYHTYTPGSADSGTSNQVKIQRIKIPAHHSGLKDQSLAFGYFAWHALRVTRGRQYDIVFATSSRLMTGTLGALIAKRERCLLYLDIRDIFVDTLKGIFKSHWGRIIYKLFIPIERWTIRQATGVNLVSPGFLGYFNRRYPHKNFSLHTNGVDEIFIKKNLGANSQLNLQSTETLKVIYAGNIGQGQGLHIILPELANRLHTRVEFHLIGDGGCLLQLRNELHRHNVKNVHIHKPMNRARLLQAYDEADILFLHLNSIKALKRVLPSKIFEYAATDKPIWGGLSGYAREFAQSHIKNIGLFDPCDIDQAVKALDMLSFQPTPRKDFIALHSRRSIKKRMAKDVLHLSSKYRARNE